MNYNPTSAEEQYILGKMYQQGKDVPPDNEKAAYWYLKAAEKGHAAAQFDIGVFYHRGIGVPEDSRKAVYWYTKSAEQSDADAQYNLGVMYECGVGVSKDRNKAKYWYTKAAEQGHEKAKKEISSGCYIATAVYGSYEAPEVLCLRRFRDEVLSITKFGRFFIKLYYHFSPPIAEKLKNAKHINVAVRRVLDKIIKRLNANSSNIVSDKK